MAKDTEEAQKSILGNLAATQQSPQEDLPAKVELSKEQIAAAEQAGIKPDQVTEEMKPLLDQQIKSNADYQSRITEEQNRGRDAAARLEQFQKGESIIMQNPELKGQYENILAAARGEGRVQDVKAGEKAKNQPTEAELTAREAREVALNADARLFRMEEKAHIEREIDEIVGLTGESPDREMMQKAAEEYQKYKDFPLEKRPSLRMIYTNVCVEQGRQELLKPSEDTQKQEAIRGSAPQGVPPGTQQTQNEVGPDGCDPEFGEALRKSNFGNGWGFGN